MVVRSLYALIVALAVVAGVEIGFLRWGNQPTQDAGNREQGTGDRIRRTSCPVPGSSCPVPAVAPAEITDPVIAQAPVVKPVRKRRKLPGQVAASADALAECARSGGPLCGMPDR
jgi:hypothetical protein